MGDKDETWWQKICFHRSPLLLFRALCRDRLQKEFDRCKARSSEKCRSFHFYMVRSVAEICALKQRLSLSKVGLERFASSDDDIFLYTGFQSYNALIAFWNFIKPCAESLLSWNRVRAKLNGNLADTAFPYLQGQTKEKQRKWEIEPIDQLWMFLTRVQLGLFESDLAHRFDVSGSTVSDVVVTWATYLYIVVGSLPVWPSKEKIKEGEF